MSAARIAPEIIECIREGRAPTVQELSRVAAIILREMSGHQSIFPWEHPPGDERGHVLALRFALAALVGDTAGASECAAGDAVQRKALLDCADPR